MGKKGREGKIPKPRQTRERYGNAPRGTKTVVRKGAIDKNRAGRDKNDESYAHLEREGKFRKTKLGKEVQHKHLNTELQKMEDQLKRYTFVDPLVKQQQVEAFELKKKERLFGAPRPWDSRMPSKHGCTWDVYECMDRCGDWENAPKEENLFESAAGKFWDLPETRAFCQTLNDLGQAQLKDSDMEEAVETFKRLLSLDEPDHACGRHGLLFCYMDLGELGHARALLDSPVFKGDTSALAAYSRALIEYIAWALLEEEDASEESACAARDAAVELNPYAGAMLAASGSFMRAIDPDEVPPAQETEGMVYRVEEAMCFAVQNVSLWNDADGAPEWLEDALDDTVLVEPLINPHPSTGLAMYKAVLEDLEEQNGGGDQMSEEDDEEPPGLVNPEMYTKTVLSEGNGILPKEGQAVKCKYKGFLDSGKEFDSSFNKTRKKHVPLTFRVGKGEVIKGWDQAVLTMSLGEKAKIVVESAWAYGKKGCPPRIPPNARLTFEIELVAIIT
ncbi:hypothetical protein CYMTET_22745 [Cymbomonas tetramitiformis]|uniref:peptidylprolyl isomerase n=1 Tax=Cymbomonas tetramitiformis TaxID=36881 RepID=A0AAE0FZL4_9CHLO|nr:hypothetical protein CYMTET_22745 [Cymbomonas tetramitiformis]